MGGDGFGRAQKVFEGRRLAGMVMEGRRWVGMVMGCFERTLLR